MLELTRAFWRKSNFTDSEGDLLDALFKAHEESARRQSPSTVNLINTFSGSGDLMNAYASAILATGFQHAPLVHTAQFLEYHSPAEMVKTMLSNGFKIPGWGGTWQKDGPDPIWEPVDSMIRRVAPVLATKIADVTSAIWEEGKTLFPNPSAYTAAVALHIELPSEFTPYLFVAARLSAWTGILLSS